MSPTEVPSTLLPDSVVAHSHAEPVVAHDHAPTQFDEESAVDTQSDDPFQFDDPPVPAPVILSQSNPVYDHRDDLPHHIRTQLQSRIRKPAQNLEPDAKRLRLDAGKRAVLMLSHDVSSGPECCKLVTIFKSCENSGCADVLLTRRAANKEVQYDALVKSQQVRVDAAMVREWDKWNEFGVTKFLSKKQLNDIMKRNPDQKIVGTRWVFTEKTIQGKPDYKARLVVQGCQEDKGYIRTDAPTGSRDAFFMTLSAAAQSGWDYSVFDAQSAYLQSDGIKRLLLLRMPHKNPPPGTKPGQVFVATGSIYGTRDAGRAWYEHSKKVLEAAGFVESRLEQGLYYLHGPSGLEALVHTHVDDFLSAFKKASKKYKDALQHLVHELHLKQQSGLVVYCGRTICRDGNHIKVTQTRSTMSLECMSIDLAGRTLESPLTNAEITGYRSVLGQLLWLGQQSRPDLCVGVSLAAQRLSKATLSDVKTLNKLVEQAKNTAEMGIVIPCGVVNLETCSVACYADAGFANAEHEKSQCGLVCCLTHSPELLKTGRFDLSTIISWQSSTIKRVVRSTLAAEGYAVSEGLESAQWFRHLLTEAHMARSSLKNVEKDSLKRPAIVFTDSDSLANTVKKDVGQSHDKRFRIVVSMLREGFGEVENTSLQWLPTHLQVADPLTKMMERDILVSFFNSRAFQPVAKKIYASRTATENV